MFRKNRLRLRTSGSALDQRKAMGLPVKLQPSRWVNSSNHFCVLCSKKLVSFIHENRIENCLAFCFFCYSQNCFLQLIPVRSHVRRSNLVEKLHRKVCRIWRTTKRNASTGYNIANNFFLISLNVFFFLSTVYWKLYHYGIWWHFLRQPFYPDCYVSKVPTMANLFF